MIEITEREVLKLMKISKIGVESDNFASITHELQQVLNYVERVTEVAMLIDEPSSKNINVFREDVVDTIDSEDIISQAPVTADSYFVVPKVLEDE